MPRRRGPVPYELIGQTRGWSVTGHRRAAPTEAMPIGPGRAIRVPAGYLVLAGVAIVAALVGAFAWGFSRGESAARADTAKTLAAAVAARSVRDPLDPFGDSAIDGPAVDRSASAERPEAGAARGPAATGGDPRLPGLNYFVIAHATAETAPDLAAFCRGQGLEAHVVADHNGVLRKVIVTPGYADGARRSESVQVLERRIRDVGLAWKSHRRGNADFSGAYPELFRGAPRSE